MTHANSMILLVLFGLMILVYKIALANKNV